MTLLFLLFENKGFLHQGKSCIKAESANLQLWPFNYSVQHQATGYKAANALEIKGIPHMLTQSSKANFFFGLMVNIKEMLFKCHAIQHFLNATQNSEFPDYSSVPKNLFGRTLLQSPDSCNLYDLTLGCCGIHFASLCPIYQAAQITLYC